MAALLVAETKKGRRGERPPQPPRFRLTPRDAAVVDAVWRLRFATCSQLCDLLFTPGGRSRCQRRLTLLFQAAYVDKLRRRLSDEPDVYHLGRGAVAGLKLQRSRTSARDLLRRTRTAGQLEHVLAVNDVRCRFHRAARESGLTVADWRDQAELFGLCKDARVIPDGFFLLRRQVGERAAVTPYLLEVERSPRGPRSVLEKYARLVRFHRSGGFEARFGRRALRLLIVTSSVSLEAELSWARRLRELADRASLGFGFFGSHRELLTQGAATLFDQPIWWRGGPDKDRVALGRPAGLDQVGLSVEKK